MNNHLVDSSLYREAFRNRWKNKYGDQRKVNETCINKETIKNTECKPISAEKTEGSVYSTIKDYDERMKQRTGKDKYKSIECKLFKASNVPTDDQNILSFGKQHPN